MTKIKFRQSRLVTFGSFSLTVAACVGLPFEPQEPDAAGFLARTLVQSGETVRVTTAVPSPDEAEALVGVDLDALDIQPVWIQVENLGDTPLRVAHRSIDAEYFSPMEVAWRIRRRFGAEGRAAMERWFYDNALPRRVPPGESAQGYVMTHRTAGTKGFNIDVFRNTQAKSFTFFVPVPGFRPDYMDVDFDALYAPTDIRNVDLPGLFDLLGNVGCCSRDDVDERDGDPLNVVLVGSPLAVRRALLRGEWQETSSASPDTELARTHRYRGRPPDGTFHHARPDGRERKELRLWLAPYRVGDDAVWFGQVSYDMSGAFGLRAFLDRRIDPDVDAARLFLAENLWYTQSLLKFGVTGGIEAATIDSPWQNFHGDNWFTDGRRAVLVLSADPVAMDETEIIGVDRPLGTGPVEPVPPPNDRLLTSERGDFRITTAVPTAEEARNVFGVNLYRRNIQAVWLSIENRRDETLWFLPTSVDSAYYTPIETSFRLQNRIRILNPLINRNFYELQIGARIAAGDTLSGYVFTRVDRGTKSFNIDVVGDTAHVRETFFVPVPGLRLDHYDVDWDGLYAPDEWQDVNLQELTRELEALPCCVTDDSGSNNGDPLNIVVVGDLRDVYYAFMRAGWDETETIYGGSLWATIKSAIGGSEYRYSPVSALYVYGRPQDVALQKSRSSINQRNHLRLWLTPLRFEGKPVFIGQISRDIGVRLTWKTVTTHKIDPDVDETREYLLEDLAYAQSLTAVGYVRGVGAAAFDAPRGNLTGDPYFTDGLRVVLFVPAEVTDIAGIELLDLGARPAEPGS